MSTVIKSAAVPHYSRSSGKIVYAVRVCPVDTVDEEPYTIYRKWDEFLDFSTRLSSVSCPDQAERAAFRRVPRLSRKVTLFVTASTHAARRDELDLFVRHLFNLPQTVTLHPLVQDFFDIKPNGLDGQLPPSPAPHAPAHFEQLPNGKTITPASAAAVSSAMRDLSYSASTSYASIKERSPGPPQPAFRAGLTSKRSTPDLRRFMSASLDSGASSSSDEDLPNMSCPTSPAAAAYPTQLAFRFPMPPAPSRSPVPSLASDNDVTVRYSAHAAKQPPSSSQTQGAKQRSGLGRDTFIEPRSPGSGSGSESGRNSISDAFSVRTTSTARPVCGGGPLSRVASPMSFTSDRTAKQEDDEEEERHSATATATAASPPPPARPAPRPLGSGSLKHFRSLQDLRSVVAPRPQLPPVPVAVPTQPPPSPLPSSRSQQGLYVPPPMTRARSDSKVLLSKPLPLVLEDESPAPSPTFSKTFRRWNNNRQQPSTPASSSSSSTRFARPSLDNLRRLAQEQFGPSSGHQHTSSTSSVESSDSSLPSLSRSQTSSAGLGFDFSSPSYESLELSSSSDHSGYFDSPDSSFTAPQTPPSAPVHQQGSSGKFDKWQQDGSSGSYLHNGNNMPPMPFFPTPGACDAITYNQGTVGRRHGLGLGQGQGQGRSRASSLHHPTLETILASPILGCEPASKPSPRTDAATVTIKLMTAHDGNFMMKLPRTASLLQLRERVYAKCRDSDVALGNSACFTLAVQSAGAGAGSGSGTATAKNAAKLLLDSAPNSPASPCSPGSALAQIIDINDEEDWQLALSLTTTKLTLRVR